jgi:hypothetical protein
MQAFSQDPKRERPILVRYIFSKGGGESRKRSSGNLWSLYYFISVSVPSSFEIFQTHLALWVLNLCHYASLLNNDIFIQPGTPSNWSKCQMYNNNENWSYFVSDILIYLGKSLQIISLFPQNLGVQRRPFFVLWASQDAWTPFWQKPGEMWRLPYYHPVARNLNYLTYWEPALSPWQVKSSGARQSKIIKYGTLGLIRAHCNSMS